VRRERRSGAGSSAADGSTTIPRPTAISPPFDYITNMRVRMDGSNILDLDDPQIFENPILYMSEPGYWTTNEAEVKNLRAYLLKGGFIIFDDFEGESMWRNMVAQMKRALPEHTFLQLDVPHPIFHSFFNIQTLDIPHPTVNVPPGFFSLFDDNDPSGRMLMRTGTATSATTGNGRPRALQDESTSISPTAWA
jgi:hypothetical protein